MCLGYQSITKFLEKESFNLGSQFQSVSPKASEQGAGQEVGRHGAGAGAE